MLFKKWAVCLAEKLSQIAGEQDSYKIAMTTYRLESLFATAFSIIILLLVAILLGIVKTAFLIACTGAVIKGFTGGLHLGTPLRCAVIGALIIAGFSYLAIYLPLSSFPIYVILLILLLINIIVWCKAPHETKNKPLSAGQRKYLALFSKVIIFILSIICVIWPKGWGVNELFYGLVFQGLNLLSISEWSMERLDNFLGKIERKPLF